MTDHLLIFGASARAAAFSALRAGYQPWCADLFADADLEARCPVTRIARRRYPGQFADLVAGDIAGPWMYTGGLENHPALVRKMAKQRPLLGNDRKVLDRVRSPDYLAGLFSGAGLPSPAVFYEYPAEVPSEGRWLLKPLRGAGGSGIRFWNDRIPSDPGRRPVYLQEYIDGESCSAVYLADGKNALLLGATRQLVGQPWLHAAPFRYCGSIGPLPLPPRRWEKFQRIGQVLTAGCKLRGLFGVDCVVADGVPFPVEVNPRYPASVEVIEHATGLQAVKLHCGVFDRRIGLPSSLVSGEGAKVRGPAVVVGKAILHAWMTLIFPADGPWSAALQHRGDPAEMPRFADIPHAGERIDVGRPILTFFARGETVAGCEEHLRQIAADLDRWLY